MKQKIAQALESAGGPHAINLKVWLLLYPLSVIGVTLSMGRASTLEVFLARSTPEVVAYGMAGFLLFLARTLIRRFANRKTAQIATVSAFIAIGFIKGAIWETVAVDLSIIKNGQILERGFSMAISYATWSILLAYLLQSVSEYRSNLEAHRASSSTLHELEERGIEISKDASNSMLSMSLLSIERALDGANSRSALRDIVDAVIRPLARELRSTNVDLEGYLNAPIAPIRFRDLIVLRPRVTNPVTLTLAGFIVSGGVAVIWSGLVGFLVPLGASVIMMLSLVAISDARGPVRMRNVLIFALGFIASIALAELGDVVVRTDRSSFFNLALGSWILVFLTAWLLNVRSMLTNQAKTLKRARSEVQSRVAKLKREHWVHAGKLARIIHGEVQGYLLSKAVKGGHLSHAESLELKTRCQLALRQLDRDSPFSVEISEIRQVWSAALHLTFDIEDRAAEHLEADPILSASAIELVRECITNAVKHGEAKTFKLSCDFDTQHGVLKFVAKNDGRPLTQDFVVGAGSAVFQELAYSWERASTIGGVTVTFQLKL